MVVHIQPFLLFVAIFLHERHNMTLKIVFNSNILNNKGIQTSFSVQILSIFTFSGRKRASFSHYPIVLGYKNHISPNIIFAGQKKKSYISLLLKSKKSMVWHF